VNWDYTLTADVLMTTRLDWQYVGETNFHTLQGTPAGETAQSLPTIWDFFGTLGGGVPPGPHPVNFNNATRDAYSTVNLRVSFDAEDWNLAIWAKNLTDEDYLQEVIPTPEFGGSFIQPSARDSYGIDFTYRF
jgi:iron complex outermembrane receptor protein